MFLLCRYDDFYVFNKEGVLYKSKLIEKTGENWYSRNNKIVLKEGSLITLQKGINYYTGSVQKLPKNIKFVSLIDLEFNKIAGDIDYTNDWVYKVLMHIESAEYIKDTVPDLFRRTDKLGQFSAENLSTGTKVLLYCDYYIKHIENSLLMVSTAEAGDNALKPLFNYVKDKPIILYDQFLLYSGYKEYKDKCNLDIKEVVL